MRRRPKQSKSKVRGEKAKSEAPSTIHSGNHTVMAHLCLDGFSGVWQSDFIAFGELRGLKPGR